MSLSDRDFELLVSQVTTRVMKIVNKHHDKKLFALADCKAGLRRLLKAHLKLEQDFQNTINNFKGDHISLESAFSFIKNLVQSHAEGVQNVYEKFSELEKKQLAIEELLQSDKVKAMIQTIPDEQTISRMFNMIDNHPISEIQKGINEIRENLEEMVERFTF